jgi:peptidyl-prolyl cis-trans isomerase D
MEWVFAWAVSARRCLKDLSMFEFVRRHNRLLQIALVLLIFPSFVVFGIQGYQRFSGDGSAVAEVAGRDITQPELDAAYRQQIERMRAQMPGVDVKLFDTPQMRLQVLDGLVRERVLLAASHKLLVAPSDEEMLQRFRTDPQFAALRNPDGTVRRELLAARGLSSEQFALQLKQDMGMRQVLQGITDSDIAAQHPASAALDALYQQRDVHLTRFETKDYTTKVQVGDAEVQAFYDDAKNTASLQAPESATVEYVVLDLASIKKAVSVSEDDLRTYYNENKARYTQPEERRVRHILIKADKTASADERAKAKVKAEAVLAALQKNRAAFADVAKKESQDPGSAPQGGELDWFGRGAMTKPFEDAAFALKKGDLSGVVESDFGYHLIEVLDSRGGGVRSFESVRGEMEEEVKQQLAQKRFTDQAEQFTDAVDQEDGLKAVADKFKLELRRADAVQRSASPGVAGPLANPKLLDAVFQPDSLQKKHNVPVVEIGANQLASARVLDYQPARKQPLAEVKDRIRDILTSRKAQDAARKDGQAQLVAWQAKPQEAKLDNALTVSRSKAQEQGRELVDGVLRAKIDNLPAWVGVDLGPQGYAVVRIDKVSGADMAALGDAAQARTQYARLWAQAEGEAYYASLRERFKARIHKAQATAADAAGGTP